MDYAFLVDTYASERLKTLSVWAMFKDADLDIRPHQNLARDRTFREHMVHQCMSEDSGSRACSRSTLARRQSPPRKRAWRSSAGTLRTNPSDPPASPRRTLSGGGKTLPFSTRSAAAHGSW